jgi:hypothetical protein
MSQEEIFDQYDNWDQKRQATQVLIDRSKRRNPNLTEDIIEVKLSG